MDKLRARSEDDKRTRHDEILESARDVFDAVEFDAFTMDAVAAKLGLAKGTLYRYFPTREGLLLALTGLEYAGWFDAVDRGLALLGVGRRAGPRRVDERVTTVLVDEVLSRPRFMRLLSVAPTVLERNVPYDVARSFKLDLLGRITTTSRSMAAVLLVADQHAAQLLFHLQAAVIGLYHHAHPAPVVAEVFDDPDLALFRIDLRAELTHAVAALIAATRT